MKKIFLLIFFFMVLSSLGLVASQEAQSSDGDAQVDYSSKQANEIVETELARFLPPFVAQQKTLLRSFIEVNRAFESSNNLLLRRPSYFLESQSIEASYDVLKELKEQSDEMLEGDAEYVRSVYNNREALADAYVSCYATVHHVESGNPKARESKVLVSSPIGIIASYLAPSLEISSLLNQALMYATTKRSGPLCRTLLYSGANPNFQDKRGWTPLIRLALRHHCLRQDVAEFDQWKTREDGVIARLAGGDIEPPLFNFVPLLTDFGAEVGLADPEGITPLHAACMHANVQVVQQLLHGENPTNLSPLTNDGHTPLMLAGRNSHMTRNRQLILIYFSDCAQRNMRSLTEEDTFAQNMPYATAASAKDNEEHLVSLARGNRLRAFAQKLGTRNVAHAVAKRERGIPKGVKLAMPVRLIAASEAGLLKPRPSK